LQARRGLSLRTEGQQRAEAGDRAAAVEVWHGRLLFERQGAIVRAAFSARPWQQRNACNR
jgi:hypothetical protein